MVCNSSGIVPDATEPSSIDCDCESTSLGEFEFDRGDHLLGVRLVSLHNSNRLDRLLTVKYW